MTALDFLFVFAHPDDESFYSGGLIAEARIAGLSTHVLSLTPGNTPERAKEFSLALQCLESSGTLGTFLDGHLEYHHNQVAEYIQQHIIGLKPSHIVTFGGEPHYNHRDHIAIEKAVVAARQKTAPKARLWKRAYRPEETYALRAMRAERPITPKTRILEPARLHSYQIPNHSVMICPAARRAQLAGLACHHSQRPDSLAAYVTAQPHRELYFVD